MTVNTVDSRLICRKYGSVFSSEARTPAAEWHSIWCNATRVWCFHWITAHISVCFIISSHKLTHIIHVFTPEAKLCRSSQGRPCEGKSESLSPSGSLTFSCSTICLAPETRRERLRWTHSDLWFISSELDDCKATGILRPGRSWTAYGKLYIQCPVPPLLLIFISKHALYEDYYGLWCSASAFPPSSLLTNELKCMHECMLCIILFKYVSAQGGSMSQSSLCSSWGLCSSA